MGQFTTGTGAMARPRWHESVRTGHAVLAAAAGAIAVLALIGWAIHSPLLKAGLPEARAVQPLSAVLILAGSLALMLTASTSRSAGALRIVLCGLVLVACGFVFTENYFNVDWGSDSLLFPSAVQSEQTAAVLRPGRPAAGILIALTVLSLGLLLVDSRRRWAQRAYVYLATFGLLSSLAALLAYGFSIRGLLPMGLYANVPLLGAASLWLLFTGTLIRRSDLGWVHQLARPTLGGQTSRSMLVWTVAVLVVVAVIVQFGARALWFRSEVAVVLVALSGVTLLFAGLLAYGHKLDVSDEALRRERADLLLRLQHELRNPLAAITSSADLLVLRVRGDPSTEQAVRILRRQVDVLSRAVEGSILDYGEEAEEPRPIAREPLSRITARSR